MHIEEVKDRLTRLMADTLGVPVIDLSADFSRDSVGQWDSIAHLMAMLAIEEEFDIGLSINEIGDTRSIADMAGLVMSQVREWE